LPEDSKSVGDSDFDVNGKRADEDKIIGLELELMIIFQTV
jgi:hypothetical protein